MAQLSLPISVIDVTNFLWSVFRKHVPLDNILHMTGNPFDIPAHVMLEGASGTGKTALCSFIVLQWARQTGSLLERYNMVLFIELKRVQPTGTLNFTFSKWFCL